MSDTPIDTAWLAEWCDRQHYGWEIRDTDYFLFEQTTGYSVDLGWWLHRLDCYGDEAMILNVNTRGDLLKLLVGLRVDEASLPPNYREFL